MTEASNTARSGIPLLLAALLQGPAFAQPLAPPAEDKLQAVLAQVEQYCGGCHKVPPPDVMPKAFWPRAVKIMADMGAERFGPDFMSEESIRDITAFYYGSSPETLPRLPYLGEPISPAAFEVTGLGERSRAPLVINVNAVEPTGDADIELLVCDGAKGQVISMTRTGDEWTETVLAAIQLPARTAAVDFDDDGDRDIIVAALGQVTPSNQKPGKVLLLRQARDGSYDQETLLEGVGRLTDARPADLDGDGDFDIAVAVFGDGGEGEVSWLENLGDGRWERHVLIDASGPLNVSLADLDRDGRIDIVSLIAQEYETVMALMNRGDGAFERVPLTSAPHPMYGFTGMSVVDLDSDGDEDFLLTNGDAQDLHLEPKPYHGVQWLENEGGLRFRFHDIGRFYGAATAVAGDLDGDGDLDVVASSWDNFWDDEKRQSLVWFENDGAQGFARRNLLNRPRSIVTLELVDATGDERMDIIAGGFRMDLLRAADADVDVDESKHPLADARLFMLENRLER